MDEGFCAQKRVLNSWIIPSTSFVLILLGTSTSLISFSPEEVIGTRNEHNQKNVSVNMSIIDFLSRSLGFVCSLRWS